MDIYSYKKWFLFLNFNCNLNFKHITSICLQACVSSWNIFPSLYHTPCLERHSFITTQFVRSLR